MKKFTNNDIFVNTIKVYPKVKIFTNSGILYYNDTNQTGPVLNDFLFQTGLEIPQNSISTESNEALLTESGDYIVIE